ncbi:MAG: glycoside hydrolase family 10 protein [Gemmatimonadota bacterium]
MKTKAFTLMLFAALITACSDHAGSITDPPPVVEPDTAVPPLQREMRGLWIATVANIDWPSRRTLTAEQQQAELIDILTRAASNGINAIVLHVRPAADALYESSLEPWGVMLTGTQGSHPGYDPLAFAIREAHARGLELHAWINPFRAGNTRDTAQLAASHVFHARRDWVRVYGSNLWLDPGEPAAQEHSLRVIKDIVARYDIDAIHADDYFYPYVENDAANVPIPFPDDATFAQHGAGSARGDWRRANIDRFVERMYREVHAIKPTLKVGISPFGIWRPGNPPGVQGLDAYASIYADSRKWLQEGWIDYLAPQLYWAIAAPQQSFPALLDWWLAQNPKGRHVWPGLAAYRVENGTSSAFTSSEIPNQIRLTRDRNARGQLLYNTTWTLKQRGGQLAGLLAADVYKDAAVIPATPWLDGSAPAAPALTLSGSTIQITPAPGEAARWWIIRVHSAGQWRTRVQFGTQRSLSIDAATVRVLVHGADAVMNLSAPAEWRRPPTA